MEPRSCAIIGQRPARFRFGYKENNAGCKRLKKRLRDQFMSLYGQGVRKFYVGGCIGVDQWDEWHQSRQKFLIAHCVEHMTIGTAPQRRCYVARNRYLVDHADVLVAVYDDDRTVHSGTGQTVLYAERRSVPVVFIHPDTGIISIHGDNPQQTNQFILVDFSRL